MSGKPTLPIHDLAARHDGLTEAIAESYTEAARVCLDRHHSSPIDFQIDIAGEMIEAITEWKSVDVRTKRAWANELDATEAGAYACALAAVELVEGMVAIYRAETKTGADYYIALSGTDPVDLEDCVRLEVSGVDRGPNTSVAQRLRAKLDQVAAGESNLPAMAGVVGFRARTIMLAPLEK